MEFVEWNTLPPNFSNESLERYFNAVFTYCHNRHAQNIDSQYVSLTHFFRYFVSWFVPSIIIFGEIGTLLCLVVLLKRRTGTTETRVWFVALSLSDMYTLAVGLTFLYASRAHYIFSWLARYDARNRNKFNCYFLNGMIYFGLLVSTWIQVGISVLRVISVKSKQPSSNKPRTFHYIIALVACISVCLLITIIKIGISLDYKLVKPCKVDTICYLKPKFQMWFFYSSLILKVILPSSALLCCSIIIIIHLQKFKRQFSDKNNLHYSVVNSSLRKRIKQKQISYTLLGMNLTFFILTLPFELFKIFLYYNIIFTNKDNAMAIDKFLNILLYVNNATNWLFYFMLGPRFRQNVIELLCKKRKFQCSSLWSTVRRWNTSLRSQKRTKSTQLPVIGGASKSDNAVVKHNINELQPLRMIGDYHYINRDNDGAENAGLLPLNAALNIDESSSLNASEPKFYCTYPGGGQNLFPKFY